MTRTDFSIVCPRAPEQAYPIFLEGCRLADVDTVLRYAAFIAQLAHESNQFTRLEENLWYSIKGLLRVFPKYFDPPDPTGYVNQPEKIANRVYANRMGNGAEETGDGWRYRGRGYIQLTGRNNYVKFGKTIGIDLLESPDAASEPEIAMKIAVVFWGSIDGNRLADNSSMTTLTRRVSGGLNGLDDRMNYYNKALEQLRWSRSSGD